MSEDQYELCRHIHTNGKPCKSPALTSKNHCYFHAKLHKRHRFVWDSNGSALANTQHPPGSLADSAQKLGYPLVMPLTTLELPPLEDSESIQLSISLIIAALASGRMESKRATALLYGLQLASSNVRHVNNEPYEPVRDFLTTRAGLELTP